MMAKIRLDQTEWNRVVANPGAEEMPEHYSFSNVIPDESMFTVFDVSFTEPIDLIFFQWRTLVFIDCIFEEGLLVQTQGNQQERPAGCILILEKCQIQTFRTRLQERPNDFQHPMDIHLVFKDCSGLQEINIDRYGSSLRVVNSQTSRVNLSSVQVSTRNQGSFSLEMVNYRVYSLTTIDHFHATINIQNCSFGMFSLGNGNLSGTIEESEFTDIDLDGAINFQISKSKLTYLSVSGSLTLLKISGVEVDSVEFLKVSGDGQIIIEGGSDLGTLAMGKVAVKDISITDAVVGRVILPLKLMSFASLSMNGTESKKLKIGQLIFFKGLFQDPNSKDKTSVSLELIELLELSFVSVINNANFFASYVVGESTKRQNYKRIDPSSKYTGLLSNHGIEIPVFYGFRSYFQVVSSDLGKVNFVSCDFSAMPMLIKASKINEIFLSGTEMPKILQGNYDNVQVGYGQLKKVYDNRGDSVASGEYLKFELEAHYYSLKQIISEGRWSQTQFWDFISLGLNRFTNDFGTSWARAALIFFVSMVVLYIFHNKALGYSLGPYFYPVVWTNFCKIFGLFPEFLFPIHKADYIPGELKVPVTSWSRFWDTIGKVWGGYLIYQFVQAFRKYGKK